MIPCEGPKQLPVMTMNDTRLVVGGDGPMPAQVREREGLGKTTRAKVGYVASGVLFGSGTLCMLARGPDDCCATSLMFLGAVLAGQIMAAEVPEEFHIPVQHHEHFD